MIADDLFAGAGGWDLAARRLGIHARGVENMKEARATRDAAGLTTIHDDVWTFDPLASVRAEGETNADVYARVYRETGSGFLAGVASGLIASPPCQTFSQAGKGAGRKALTAVLALLPRVKDLTLEELRTEGARLTPPLKNGDPDDRTALVLTPLWFLVHHGTYRWAAWEQVPTVLPVWEACADVLRSEGWSVWTGRLQAEQFGVPQTRKRAFLLASRDHEVSPPLPTHSRYYSRTPAKLDSGVAKWVSMAEALDFGLTSRPAPTVTGGGTETGGAEPIAKLARYTSRADWMQRRNSGPGAERRPRSVNEPAYTVRAAGSGSHPCGIELLPEWCHKRPATTVVDSFRPDVIAAPGYRTTVSRQNAPDSVRVTVAEAGVLQSFPADYPWQGAKGKQYLQCGNAVPPLLAEAALCAALGLPFLPNMNPARTDSPIGESGVVLRNNNTANAAVRPIETPAPTLYFGQRCNYVAFERAPIN